MHLSFVTVDVFTDRRFGGNPLAVVPDAVGLSTSQMQAIAAEFNLSETTFVLPPRDDAHTAEVRIFTPRAELPFAGHPNIGTAFVLGRVGHCHGRAIAGTRLLFEERAGLVALDLVSDGSDVAGARLAAPQPFAVGAEIAVAHIAECCSIGADGIETARHPPCIASCGMPFVFAEVKSLGVLAAAQPRYDLFVRNLPMDLATGIHLYTRLDGAEADLQARMFAPLHGINEDPATGSANVALIGLLAERLPQADADLSKTIAQGVEMGRPSRLEASAVKIGGTVRETFIGGTCIAMMQGTLELD